MKIIKNYKPKLFNHIVLTQFAILVISVFIVFSLIYNQIYEFIIIENSKNNSNIVFAVEKFLLEELDEPKNVLLSIESQLMNPKISNLDINELLSNLIIIYPYFEDIELLNKKGLVVHTLNNHLNELDYDRSFDKPIVESNLSNDEFNWSGIMLSPYSDSRVISLVKKYDDGYIVGYINLKFIQDSLISFINSFDESFNIIITDRFGTYLVYEDTEFVNERRIFSEIELSKLLINENKRFFITKSKNPKIIHAASINEFNWIVTIQQPLDSAMRLMDSFIYFFFIFVSSLFILFIISTSLNISKISRGILKFSQKLTKYNQINDTMESTTYFQEFKILEDSFSKMLRTIEEKDLRLQDLAYNDPLTQLFSRTYLIEFLIPNLNSKSHPYTILYIDLDNFSKLNDTFGHDFGDLVLVDFTDKIKNIFQDDVIVRLGGDEFIIITYEEEIETIKTKFADLNEILINPIIIKDVSIFVSFSAGLSNFPEDGSNFFEILKYADLAMYVSKENGKNCWTKFDLNLKQLSEKRLQLDQYLHYAIERSEFYMVFQPQVNSIDSKLRGFEALIRWENDIIGNISPEEFIPIAEENRRIIEIGRWVIDESCKFIKNINSFKQSDYIISVNCSPVELTNFSYSSYIEQVINKYEINPKWLEVEITENISLHQLNEILPQLFKLKSIGISIAIDDFGTGYSSLSYLQNIPLNVLKIDKVFIRNLNKNTKNYLMITTIVRLAKSLKLKLVAEGVENIEEFNLLKDLGCDYIQGYYVSKPISIKNVIDYLKSNKS